MRTAFGVSEELLEPLRHPPGIDDLEQFLFAVLQGLRGPPRLLFATPLFALSLPALAFELRLPLSFLRESCDFHCGLLQIPDNGRDAARKTSGRRF